MQERADDLVRNLRKAVLDFSIGEEVALAVPIVLCGALLRTAQTEQ